MIKVLALGFVKKSRIILLLPIPIQDGILKELEVNQINADALRQLVEANTTMLSEALLSTVRTTAMIMLILMAAFTVQFAFARLGISVDMAEWVAGLNLTAVER